MFAPYVIIVVDGLLNTTSFQMDPELDRNISDHVLRMHRYRNANEQDGDGMFYYRMKHFAIHLLNTNDTGNEMFRYSRVLIEVE